MKIPRSKAAQAVFSMCLSGYPKKFAALFRACSVRRKITSIANFGIKGFFLFMCSLMCVSEGLFALDKNDWKEEKGDHFIVYYRDAKEDFVRQTLDKAEEYYKSITEELGFTRYNFWLWSNRAKIYIYDDAEDYQSRTGKPSWSGGVAYYHEKVIETYPWAQGFFQSLLPHELGHIIFREFIGAQSNAPVWLDEGVAMYQEKYRRKDIRTKLLEAIDQSKLMPLGKLSEMNIMFVKDKDVVELYYTEAISVVEYLITHFGKDNFVRLCKALKERKTFDQAIEESYRVFKNLDDLHKGWLRYIKE